MKKAIVLAGGGAKGAYQAGFIKAIKELNVEYDIVTGVSIGALNGCLLVQNDDDKLIDLYANIQINDIVKADLESFDIDILMKQHNKTLGVFKELIIEKGLDITPFSELIDCYLNEEKLFKSNVDFGVVCTNYPSFKPLMVTKSEMKNHVKDYLLATSAAFPILPMHKFNDLKLIDGGFSDNCPIDLAFDMGATRVIACDIDFSITHSHYINNPFVDYIYPSAPISNSLDFDHEHLINIIKMGYYDTMKYYNKYNGIRSTFNINLDIDYELIFSILLKYERDFNLKGSLVNAIVKNILKITYDIKDIYYIILDLILDSIDKKPDYYQHDEIYSLLYNEFEDVFDNTFELFPEKLSIKTFKTYFSNLNDSLIIKNILNEIINNNSSNIKIYLTAFPFQFAAALFLIVYIKK